MLRASTTAIQGIDRITPMRAASPSASHRASSSSARPAKPFWTLSNGVREFVVQSIKTIEAEALCKPC